MDFNEPGTTLPSGEEQNQSSGVRKLAAIMFTDIKDFSGRMQKDEEGTMRMLRVHNTMMRTTVEKYSGHVVKTVGDAFLVSFNSVVSATQCAIEVQQNFHQYNLQFKADDEKILVRIGIHLGDVIETDKDIFGDGVNIASRVQSLAEVGGLTVSESVYQQVKNKLNISVINLGVPQLKGISEAIKLYQVIIIPSDKARGKIATNLYIAKTILKRKKTKRILGISLAILLVIASSWYFLLRAKAPPNSLAVLPFNNLVDSTIAYKVDGITEDLTDYLSQEPHLKVLSTGSTQAFKNSDLSEKEIARRLGVRFLVIGTVVGQPNDFTIRVHLKEPGADNDVWGQSYLTTPGELSANEFDIQRNIKLNLDLKLEGSTHIPPPKAEDAYLLGLNFDRKQTKEQNQLAIKSFTNAVEIDTAFQMAYLKRANCDLINIEYGWDINGKWLVDAENSVKKAYLLDSSIAELYSVWGRLLLAQGKRSQGMENLERCVRMNPNYMRAYLILGVEYLQNLNNPDTAIVYFQKAFDLEPMNFNTSMDLGVAYAYKKNYTEAIRYLRHATSTDPNHGEIWHNLGALYTRASQLDSATMAYENSLRLDPSNHQAAANLAEIFLVKNQFDSAQATIQQSLKSVPNDYLLLYMLSLTEMQKGSLDSAKKVWTTGLKLAETGAKENPKVSEHSRYAGLFSARLGMEERAIKYGQYAFALDSSEESVIGLAKIYSVLGKKSETLDWFSRARKMNSEYDQEFLTVSLDFQRYRKDSDLLLMARE